MNSSLTVKYFYIFGLLASVYILMIGGTSFVVYLTLAAIAVMLIGGAFANKLKISKRKFDSLYFAFFISSLFTLLSSRIYTSYPEWKWQGFVFFIYYSILFAFYFLGKSEKADIVSPFICGLKVCVLIQVAYGYLQFLLYTVFSVDINNFLFNQTFHIVKEASHYNYGVLVPTGFSWHPGTLAPLLVIGYCLYKDKFYIKALIVGLAFLTQSSTCVIGVIAVVGLELVFRIIDRRKDNKKSQKRTIIGIGIAIVALVVALTATNIWELISFEISRLWFRFQNRYIASGSDLSTFYHMRYYTGLGEIASRSSFLQILFGVGGGCSGYPFVKVFSQYVSYMPWDVEAQIVADLIDYGIVGFSILYIWIFRLIKRGYKLDRRYAICLIAILAESVTYNVRFMWVLIFMMIMNISISAKINVWDIESFSHKQTRKQIIRRKRT